MQSGKNPETSMGNDNFWERLLEGSNSLFASSIDSHFSDSSESFVSVRGLTDKIRSANSLQLPVEAGTKVLFAGGMGAYLTYGDCPPKNSRGEVVLVKSANGGITHHEGKVFVKWDDGKLRTIHAEHLRLVKAFKTSSLGDLTQFLKKADGKLVHKSTNDLWSYSKGADGNFVVERLFDDEGEPLKG